MVEDFVLPHTLHKRLDNFHLKESAESNLSDENASNKVWREEERTKGNFWL